MRKSNMRKAVALTFAFGALSIMASPVSAGAQQATTISNRVDHIERQRPLAYADIPRIQRGSSGYIPPVPAPSPPSLTLQRPPTGPYVPPPINSFSDRVIQCNQSFTFNGGIGNNPVGPDAYVRQCAN
jgi:hypothetical protein